MRQVLQALRHLQAPRVLLLPQHRQIPMSVEFRKSDKV